MGGLDRGLGLAGTEDVDNLFVRAKDWGRELVGEESSSDCRGCGREVTLNEGGGSSWRIGVGTILGWSSPSLTSSQLSWVEGESGPLLSSSRPWDGIIANLLGELVVRSASALTDRRCCSFASVAPFKFLSSNFVGKDALRAKRDSRS